MGAKPGFPLFQLALVVALVCWASVSNPADRQLPPFGKDTVLVWEIQNQDFQSQFVARIAEFLPDRYLEWEDQTTQGTIFMPNRAVTNARGFVSARLFEAGVDTRGKDVTTLWLSENIYRDLKQRKRAKVVLDGIDSWMTLDGVDQLTVEVNKAPLNLPVIKVKDDRGSERWFIDNDENSLMVKHEIRKFCQTLVSITTDQPNTLRWIKGKKLTNPH